MWTLLKRVDIPLRVLSVIALVYLAYVLLARRTADTRWTSLHKTVEQKPNPEFEAAYGGTGLKILMFYAGDAVVTEGQSTNLCYGVVNAKSVRIDPFLSGVIPSINNCLAIEPEHDTQYTLTAEGKDGKTATETFKVAVKPDPETIPKITALEVVRHTVDAGRHYFTIAFRFQNARQVSIDPPVFSPLEDSAPFGQFAVAPQSTTTYTLTVTGKKGRKASKSITVEIPGSGRRP